MCDIDRYYQLYHAHAGQPGAYHLRRVRWARLLIDQHRRTCAECRGMTGHSNYNVQPPARLNYTRKGA